MKNIRFVHLNKFIFLYFFFLINSAVFSQSDSNNKRIINDSRLAKNEFIKEMFIRHIKARQDKINRKKIKKDAEAILNSEERFRLGFSVD